MEISAIHVKKKIYGANEELSEKTLEAIKKSEEDIKFGRIYSLEEVKKELGLN